MNSFGAIFLGSDFRAQLGTKYLKNAKFVRLSVGVNGETLAILDSLYFLPKNPTQACDLLENLGWDNYKFENA